MYEDKGLVYCHSSNCKNGGKHLDQIEITHLVAVLRAVTLYKLQSAAADVTWLIYNTFKSTHR